MRYVIGKGGGRVSTQMHDIGTGKHRPQRSVTGQPELWPPSLTQQDHSRLGHTARPGQTARNDDQMLAGPDVSSRR